MLTRVKVYIVCICIVVFHTIHVYLNRYTYSPTVFLFNIDIHTVQNNFYRVLRRVHLRFFSQSYHLAIKKIRFIKRMHTLYEQLIAWFIFRFKWRILLIHQIDKYLLTGLYIILKMTLLNVFSLEKMFSAIRHANSIKHLESWNVFQFHEWQRGRVAIRILSNTVVITSGNKTQEV